jgi:hypothetical protein
MHPARAIEGLNQDVGETGADAITMFDILVAVPEHVPLPFTRGRATTQPVGDRIDRRRKQQSE